MKKMYRNLLLGIILSITLTSAAIGSEFKSTIEIIYNKINITVNKEKINTNNILYKGTTYVPLRSIAEILDKEVLWDGKTNTASINDRKQGNINKNKQENIKKDKIQESKTLEVFFNRINIVVNGKKVDTDNILYEGTTYAPLRRVSEILDKEVVWYEKTNTASINDKNVIISEKSLKKDYLDNLSYSKNLLAEEFEKLMNLMNSSNKDKEWALKLEQNLQEIEKITEDSIRYKPVPKDFLELQGLKILSMEEFNKMTDLMEEHLKTNEEDLLFKAGNHLSEGTYYFNLIVDEVEDLYKRDLLE